MLMLLSFFLYQISWIFVINHYCCRLFVFLKVSVRSRKRSMHVRRQKSIWVRDHLQVILQIVLLTFTLFAAMGYTFDRK